MHQIKIVMDDAPSIHLIVDNLFEVVSTDDNAIKEELELDPMKDPTIEVHKWSLI